MAETSGKTQRRWPYVLAAILLPIVLLIVFFDWNWLRGPINHFVSDKLHRHFAIQGNLHVDLSMTPRIRMENVVLGNAPWGSRPTMATLPAAEFRIRLWPLIHGATILPEISLTRPDILLEKNAQGQNNWTFGPPSNKPGKPPEIGQLNINNGVLSFQDPAIRTHIRLQVSTRPPAPGQTQAALIVGGTGSFKNAPFSVQGEGGALLSLRNLNQPYPLRAQVKIGGMSARAQGTLTDPVTLRGVNLQLQLQGDDLSKLDPVIGTPLPKTAPYAISGHLTRQGATWTLANFKGRVGGSDLHGTFSVTKHQRLFMQGNIGSKLLNYKDLAGFIGAKPSGTGKHVKVKTNAASPNRVLPDKPFNLTALRKADADVVYQAQRILSPSLPLDKLKAHLTLKNGLLILHPLDFGVADGHLISQIRLDARHPTIQVNLDSTVRGLRLSKLFPKLKFSKASTGRFGGKAKITTHGNSFAAMAANADGRLGIATAGGSIADLYVALAQIHLGEALMHWIAGVKQEPIHCGVADFQFNNGLMQTRTFVVDTQTTNILGKGDVNFRNETLKLLLLTKPKHITIISARGPLHIDGTLKHPKFSFDEKTVIARGGLAVLLGAVINPLVGLLPLIDTAPGKPVDCPVLMSKAGAGVKTEALKSGGKPLPRKKH